MGFQTQRKRDGQFARSERVVPVTFPPESIGENIFLADFGLLLKAGTSVDYKFQGVISFISPERFHNYDPSPESDMWSFMVVFFYLYTGFLRFTGGYASSADA
ncbi:hypothetical protein VMCG_09223 [Cytospora schulzeri]|uniref:Protein kinase domain-containing protein n=1 Tax=Cytospora schulzeri TaxID=448051 RepID=A0A423VKV7_9PEZI|nr:hypothetical protein VMCG_09223 [Valsa malicola]